VHRDASCADHDTLRCLVPLNEVAAQITSAGGQALCVPADLADPAGPRRIVDACLARYGRVDGLVNNAAVVSPYLVHGAGRGLDFRLVRSRVRIVRHPEKRKVDSSILSLTTL
jgi:NAD(P)-dependent dehydrogenase (short-subunit alcohol dehydrogenase family)